MSDDHKHNNINISIINNQILIFEVDMICKLRESYGIIGVLSGTLSLAPQQQSLLGVPLQLSIYELLYLVDLGVCYLNVDVDVDVQGEEEFVNDLINNVKLKRIQRLKKLKNHGILQKNEELEDKDWVCNLNEHELFIETKNSTKQTNTKLLSMNDDIIQQLLSIKGHDFTMIRFQIYKDLKKKSWFIQPGLRYGGDFICYPNDPLRYHSQLIIKCCTWDDDDDDVNLIDLINFGRLGTSVKKSFVYGYVKHDGIVNYHTVEWSGFG
ncbi:hypothetical protein CANARDRAFT_30418 [[Candida] arabinofermentans NRRL YB-2248]|uniref:tRNA-splicing endonuclease subunit Sen34 n=1 Tax=[Candida] arabinofermentans NRRL YB-2248 TaxID=983967 RepID=A0A1E4SU30_9ASCO|nr:hypothetical protein CANARDRAFT_30418 [[Candida] arabinofermentans NRRL YB-2248]